MGSIGGAQATIANQEELNEYNENEEEEEKEEEDASCCPVTTCCNASSRLRDISVNEPISRWLGERVTWSSLFWLATSVSMITMTWSILYFLIGKEILPGRRTYGLFFLVIASYALGWSLAYIPRLNLPPVFGMLLAGIIFRNTGLYDIGEEIGRSSTAKIRTFCLTFVILRAGLQLTSTPIRRHPFFLLALALIPCSIEMIFAAITSRYILHYPWDWAFLTGSIIACMSPVVTVNCILALADEGYGEDKGIATLLCTATSIDDVHIVSLYSVCYSIVFDGKIVDANKNEWWAYIPGGLRDILLGFIAGSLLGFIFVFIPHKNANYVSWYRLGSLILGGLMCTTAASTIAVTGGGFLATIVMTFIATTGWRIMAAKFDISPLRKAVFFIWHFMQPILVGVIGADIDFADWSVKRFGLHVVCILIGLLARGICVILLATPTSFNAKERIFIALAWLPKGTVQAALAPMAYEQVKLDNDPARLEIALDVVRISVVSIILLAPLGAIIMMISGPLLLNKITDEEVQRERLLSNLRTVRQLQPVMKTKPLQNGTNGRS